MNGLPIRVVARRAGLRTQVVRSWERRFGVVSPGRSAGNHRLYSESDLEKLILLRKVTESGYRIGDIASLSPDQLRRLLADGTGEESPIVRCLGLLDAFDETGLRDEIEAVWLAQGRNRGVDSLLLPLLERLDDEVASGERRTVHRQMLESVVVGLLDSLRASGEVTQRAPLVIVASPLRQRGLAQLRVLAAVVEGEGWRSLMLGAGLPAEDLAHAARVRGAGAILLRIDESSEAGLTGGEFERLRRLVDDSVRLLLVGGGMDALAESIMTSQAEAFPTIASLRKGLSTTTRAPRRRRSPAGQLA